MGHAYQALQLETSLDDPGLNTSYGAWHQSRTIFQRSWNGVLDSPFSAQATRVLSRQWFLAASSQISVCDSHSRCIWIAADMQVVQSAAGIRSRAQPYLCLQHE